MPRLHLTTKCINDLPLADGKQVLYFDDGEPGGFGVLVGRRTKTFVFQRDVDGRTRRVTIGRFPAIGLQAAKDEALALYLRMKGGEDPNLTKRKRRAEKHSFGEAADLYLNSPKPRSTRTIEGYRDILRLHFSDWLPRPIGELTRWDIRERHLRIGRTAPFYANQAMRLFRAIYNSALRTFEDLPPTNPVIAVEWYPEARRTDTIYVDELSAWYHQLLRVSGNPIRRHYYVFLLLTGLRRESAATLRWADIANDLKSVKIGKPKGGVVRSFDLPLSSAHLRVLRRLYEDGQILFPNSPWLFPADSADGRIQEPRLKEVQLATFNARFSPHTLRRTFLTAAKDVGAHPYDMKLLANHAMPRGDVTAGYTSMSPSTIAAMFSVSQKIAELLGDAFENSYPSAASLPLGPSNRLVAA